MKTIQTDSRTQTALQKWSNGEPVFCPSFYFWYLGTDKQRSKLGLLRSLLYQILMRFQNRITLVFPDWEPEHASEEPAYDDLVTALQLALTCGESQTHFCFFVDGLDEYEGNTVDLASLADSLLALATIPKVKLVLSSRPLETLVEKFRLGPHLKLQDLTRTDIDKFVLDRLGQSPIFVQMQTDKPEDTKKLTQELGERAEGVFLWVHVVVISLLDGLTHRDSVADLMSRLLELPAELEALFDVILDRIPDRYKCDAFRLLHLALTWVLDRQFRVAPRALVLHLALRYQRIRPWEYRDQDKAKVHMRQWLGETAAMVNARCLGLLEIDDKSDPKSCDLDKSPKISFLHRSVVDFLNSENVRNRLKTTGGSDFDVNIGTASGLAMIFKAKLEGSKKDFAKTEKQLSFFMHYSRLAELSSGQAQTEIMADVERSMSARYPKADNWPDRFLYHDYAAFSSAFNWEYGFLPLAIASGCNLYAQERLKHESLDWQPRRPFLLYAVSPQPVDSQLMHGINPVIVEYLLSRKGRPNSRVTEHVTVWQLMLRHLKNQGFCLKTRTDTNGVPDPEYTTEVLTAVKSMVSNGADCAALSPKIKSNSRRLTAKQVIEGLREQPCPCQYRMEVSVNRRAIKGCGCAEAKRLNRKIRELLELVEAGMNESDRQASRTRSSTPAVTDSNHETERSKHRRKSKHKRSRPPEPDPSCAVM